MDVIDDSRVLDDLGKRVWVIPEGYISEESTGPEPQMTSHETACILNTSPEPALVEVVLFFADREPVGPYQLTVPGRRTTYLRFNDPHRPESLPLGTDYASVIRSDRPIVVRHMRLDSRQARTPPSIPSPSRPGPNEPNRDPANGP